MNLLLDTHTLIWYYQTNSKMSVLALGLIKDPANTVFVSAASHWEIAIKLGTGKLTIAEPFPDFVQHSIHDNGFAILPIEPRHTAELISLSQHHRDPFDRLIIAQALAEKMAIVSVDPILDAYPIRRIW